MREQTATAMYAGLDQSPVDIHALRNALDAITEHHTGMRMFCTGVMAGTQTVEDMAAMRIILAALDAAQPHIDAIYPDHQLEAGHA